MFVRFNVLSYWKPSQILSSFSRRLGDQVPAQSATRCDARKTSRNHRTGLRRAWCADYQGRAPDRSCPYACIDTAAPVALDCDATDQGSLVAPDPEGVPRLAKAVLGQAFLSAWLLLDHDREYHSRRHTSVFGAVFKT